MVWVMEQPPQASLRIGELARRVGMSPVLIRAWERRYGVLAPARSDGGYRLYSERDQVRLERIREHLDAGLSTAQAAARGLTEVPLEPPVGNPSARPAATMELSAIADALLPMLERFDESAAQILLDDALARDGLDAVVRGVVLPCLREVGRRWQFGELTTGQEHFVSSVIQGRLLSLARGWDQGDGPIAVLACPAGERHALGLICFGLALRQHGWRIVYLGADTPIASIQAVSRSVGGRVVVLAATHLQAFVGVADGVRQLAQHHRVAVGGAGASATLARRLGLVHLDGDPISAAAHLAQEG